MIQQKVAQTIERIHPLLDRAVASAIESRWDEIGGGFGTLERAVLHYGLVKGSERPEVRRMGLVVVAADHGIVMEGVTLEAQDATRREAQAFLRGRSAAAVAARQAGIETVLVDAGVRGGLGEEALARRICDGTANAVHGPAMTPEQCGAAMEAGIELAEEMGERYDVVGLGAIGVGVSCSTAMLLGALSGRDAGELGSAEAGLDEALVSRRAQALRRAMVKNQQQALTPYGALAALGGADVALMAGFMLGAAARRLPVMVDDFAACGGALAARALAPDSMDAALFSHAGRGRAHGFMLRFLAVEPLLDLQVGEGGGLGAALALGLLKTSVQIYSECARRRGSGQKAAEM